VASVTRIPRRGFLLGFLVALSGALLSPRAARAGEESPPAPRQRLFSRKSERVILALADVVVPAWNGHPAASQSPDFLPRFEALVRTTPGRMSAFGQHWKGFTREVFERVPSVGSSQPDLAALEPVLRTWYAEYRSQASPSHAARFFEMLRIDVMRTYYSSPAGWAAAGYAGPVRRSHAGHGG